MNKIAPDNSPHQITYLTERQCCGGSVGFARPTSAHYTVRDSGGEDRQNARYCSADQNCSRRPLRDCSIQSFTRSSARVARHHIPSVTCS
jgi:hypothetical protein